MSGVGLLIIRNFTIRRLNFVPFSRSCDRRERKLAGLRLACKQETIPDQSSHEMARKVAEIEKLQKFLKERDTDNKHLEGLLEGKTRVVADKDLKAGSLVSQLAQYADKYRAMKIEASKKADALQKNESTIATLKYQLKDKDDTIANVNNLIVARTDNIAKKDTELNVLVERPDAAWNSMTDQLQTMTNKEDEIMKLQSRIRDLESAIDGVERVRKRARIAADAEV